MKREFAFRLAATALLIALTVVLGLTPLGFLHVGIFYATLMCIPVIVGTLLLGLAPGLILGFAFGSLSLYVGLTAPSSLEGPILQHSIFYTVILCYVPRLLIPLVTHAVHRIAHKGNRGALAVTLSAVAGSLTNTFFYLGFVLLFYVLIGFDHAALLASLGGIILFAGLPEAAVAALVATPIVLALRKSRQINQYISE
jgi:uncharacterized membrane protein